MAHHNTVFSQILKLIPRHEFESLAQEHHQGQKLRKMTRWTQFVSLGLAKFADRVSLRDVVSNLKAQASKLYHLGCGDVNRSSLAHVNENKIGLGMQQILRLLQLNLFERRDMQTLLRGDPPVPKLSPMQTRLQLAYNLWNSSDFPSKRS